MRLLAYSCTVTLYLPFAGMSSYNNYLPFKICYAGGTAVFGVRRTLDNQVDNGYAILNNSVAASLLRILLSNLLV
ncbi:MAG: hypothetical protein QNJ65_23630 [Xenococcaceae cyanobacterium MO_234.B1]|nr:hypothetical protein [Xenococcaceae cyanobacterium MO_234.B1]